MLSLTFFAEYLVVRVHLALADLWWNGADAGYFQATVSVRVQLRDFYTKHTTRERGAIQDQLDAVRWLGSSLVQMPSNFVERVQSVSDDRWNKNELKCFWKDLENYERSCLSVSSASIHRVITA